MSMYVLIIIAALCGQMHEVQGFSNLNFRSPSLVKTRPMMKELSMKSSNSDGFGNFKEVMKKSKLVLATAGMVLGTLATPGLPAFAADTAKVGACLLKSCQAELAECITNPKCLANVICLNTCNGKKDEAECQIRCGDNFENDVVGKFNACAVSQKKCVPQKQDEGEYPVPAPEGMVKKFNTKMWNGKWYITAGLNKAFDTFDCQVHFFTSPYPGKFYAKLFWRVQEPDGEFFTKNAIQRFIQDPENPAHLINHDNEYLNYKDDWYVLDYDDDKDKGFVLVYYRGSNDAWDGYGGAFLYSREPTVRKEYEPRLQAAMENSGLKYRWSDFTYTDNTCKEQTDAESSLLREKFAKRVLIQTEENLQEGLTAARFAAINTIVEDEKIAEKDIVNLEKQLEKFLSSIEKEVEKDVIGIEQEIEKDLGLKK